MQKKFLLMTSPNRGSKTYSAYNRWPNFTRADISYVGAGIDKLRVVSIFKSILCLQRLSGFNNFSVCSNRSSTSGSVHGCNLTNQNIAFPGTNWHFTLNPGPFNMKEHVLITIFSSARSSCVYAINIVTIVKGFYKRSINILAAWLLVVTTHVCVMPYSSIVSATLYSTDPLLALYMQVYWNHENRWRVMYWWICNWTLLDAWLWMGWDL